MRSEKICGAIFFLLLASGSAPSIAFSQLPYYQGKTIKVIRGGEPGGTGDMQARALIPFFRKYIPGEPAIVVENMPGAAGRKAANHIYSTAKPDGFTIGAVGAGLVAGPILGLAGTQYDLDKLIYLGSTESGDPYVFVSGRMFAYLLGLKDPKMVVGYGGPELDIALAKGEVDARANGADTILQRNREAFEKGLFNVHASITIPKGKFDPRLPKVPELDTFARNEKERQLLNLFRTFLYPRWPYILPLGTPAEVVKILRAAIAKAFKDPEFHKEFKKLMANDPTPLTGEEMETAIRELPRDPEIVGLYKKMADHGPLPPR